MASDNPTVVKSVAHLLELCQEFAPSAEHTPPMSNRGYPICVTFDQGVPVLSECGNKVHETHTISKAEWESVQQRLHALENRRITAL